MQSKSIHAALFASVTATVALWAVPTTAHADQIFVTNYLNNRIGEYTTSGGAVNPSLVTGLSAPVAIAVSGSDLFVVNDTGTIGEYTTSGATVNASLITGLSSPTAVAVSGGDLFVTNAGNGTIAEYTTSGATVNASLVTGLSTPLGVAVSGGDLFVVNDGSDTIGEYTTAGGVVNASLVSGLAGTPWAIALSGNDIFVTDGVDIYVTAAVSEYTTSGATVSTSLFTTLGGQEGVAVSGGDLFVTDGNSDTIGEYTTSGATVNASLVAGLADPTGIAVVSTPEPSTWVLFAIGAVALLACGLRKRRVRLGLCVTGPGEPASANPFSANSVEKDGRMKSSLFSAWVSLASCTALLLGLSAGTANADLIDYWPLNDGSGSVAQDTVGGLNGTLDGDAHFVAGGPTGGAVSFDSATDDFIDVGNVLPMTGGGDFSIVAWVDTTSTNQEVIAGKLDGGIVSGYSLNVNDIWQTPGTTDFYVSEQNPYRYIVSPGAINDGNWHQVVGVYQAGGTSSLYVDGVFQSSQSSNSIGSTPTDFVIGGFGGSYGNASPFGEFDGLISGVGIYDTALTAAQVAALYTTPEPSSLVLLAVGALGPFATTHRRRVAKGARKGT